MRCDNCDSEVAMSKSLRKGQSEYPDECPECGAELQKEKSGTRIEKV